MTDQPPPGAAQIQIGVPDPKALIGAWANCASVRHSPHEFTIDFMRGDFHDTGEVADLILVQRINMSPLFVTQLIEALQSNWSVYAKKALPKEVNE